MRFVGWARAVALVVLCALGAGMWDAAESEARPRNGLIAYSKETNRCDDFDCNSFVGTVRPDGRGGAQAPLLYRRQGLQRHPACVLAGWRATGDGDGRAL